MLRIDKQEILPEVPDVTFWGDDESDAIFYPLPAHPQFRQLENGYPAFKYIMYKTPHDSDRPDGQKAGGYVFFDTELSVPEAKLKAAKQILQDRVNKTHADAGKKGTPPEVKFGTITFTKGTVDLILKQDNKIIEAVRSAGVPSLYDKNVAVFALELSQMGAIIFEKAMQGDGVSGVAVVYKLECQAKLPPITGRAWFSADKFYSFYQNVNIDWNRWGEDSYQETLREQFSESESYGTEVKFDFALPNPDEDKKLKDRVQDALERDLERMVEQKMKEAIPGVPEDKRKVPEGIENLTRDLSVHKIQSFSRVYKQNTVILWPLNPQVTLPAITSLKDKQGKPILWKDVSVYVDPDHPFFRELNVTLKVEADFQKLPISNVKVVIEYPRSDGSKQVKAFIFTDANTVQTFKTSLVNNNPKYKLYYEVSFKGSSKTLKSPVIETDNPTPPINIDDSGFLLLDLEAGDLDFEQLKAAQVTLRYEDKANGIAPIEQQFMITDNQREQRFQKLVFQPRNNAFECQIKYLMKNGKEFLGDRIKQWTSPLVVNDLFSNIKRVIIQASGNLTEKVESIFLDLTYADSTNDYSQNKSIVLNESNSFVEWEFPIISDTAGKLRYSGTIKYRDGSEEAIADTEATKNTILVGPKVAGFLKVEVAPDLIDFDLVKLARVSLQYPADGDPIARKDITFRPGAVDPVLWEVELKNKTKGEYKWQATFFPQGGSAPKKTPWETTSDLTIFPQLPQE